ncbi:murein hydrolase activator EnvC family protein [Cellulomonas xiejunii]|uniref:M23 family metallopeptidase n=1 Tax=Cellulomonas xiejunii TaxID=2968083 RepID=A0ABY5KRX8_9CELL|nr:M23 family metallopeptidase [Cellulomonas xiejunii]MCC2321946.1 M23 family metallopeptidase [Cellulomonas xiejunii]UUI73246.1 M23 family metallopeptidase [Cellulomonas xiejunii]
MHPSSRARPGTARRPTRPLVAWVVGLSLGIAMAWAAPGAAAPGPAPPADAGVYRLPLDGPGRVLRPFDPPPRPWLAGHRGVDLSAPADGQVRAPAAGVVSFAGLVAGRGVVSVLHDDGRRSSLEPVSATLPAGTRVVAGDPLGTVAGDAHGGVPGGPALHWGVREGDVYVDPWALLPGRGPVVLLPLP